MTLLEKQAPAAEEQQKVSGRRHRARSLGAVVIAVVIAGSVVWAVAREEPIAGPEETQVTAASDRETLERLVNLGYIPRQALEPSREEKQGLILRDLVNRGLIPKQALEPSMEEQRELKLRDLVNRGLIPRQTLSDGP